MENETELWSLINDLCHYFRNQIMGIQFYIKRDDPVKALEHCELLSEKMEPILKGLKEYYEQERTEAIRTGELLENRPKGD